jgi:hypothetical protein
MTVNGVGTQLLRMGWWMALALAMATLGSAQGEAPQSGTFVDRTKELGVEPGNEAACWADIDNDGWVDLCTSSGIWKNNQGQGFAKIAGGVGPVLAADIDNDGFVDLFAWAHLKLYRNDGGKGFTQFALPELPTCYPRGACFGDFNGDGFVDIYVAGYENWEAGITYPQLILTNREGKAFELTWSETRYRARGVSASDFDQDGDLDIYVSNYRLQPNVLWQNDGKGAFVDVADKYNAVGTSPGFGGGHTIGSSWGDFNNDGLIDLFVGNFAHRDSRGDQPKSRFLRNRGPEEGYTFEDLGTCGVFYQESYASPATADYDNDGDLDLFFTSVYGVASFGVPNYPVLFRNDGQFVFTDATASAQLAKLEPTYQNAWADIDNDGDLDVISAGRLYVNQGNDHRWLKVRLFGDGNVVNRSAIGAQVRIKVNDAVLTRQVEAGTGENNQNELTLHFGLAQYAERVTLEVQWPNGVKHTVRNVKTNRQVTITYTRFPRRVW